MHYYNSVLLVTLTDYDGDLLICFMTLVFDVKVDTPIFTVFISFEQLLGIAPILLYHYFALLHAASRYLIWKKQFFFGIVCIILVSKMNIKLSEGVKKS